MSYLYGNNDGQNYSEFKAQSARREFDRPIACPERALTAQELFLQSAREDVMSSRRYREENMARLQKLVNWLHAITVFFPPVGILAYFTRALESTISWYTRGQETDFTSHQRKRIGQQLLVEFLVYAILITSLAVGLVRGLHLDGRG